MPQLTSVIIDRVKDLFSLKIDTDHAGTIDSIQKSIEFKGGNLWGLIFAAFIAAIGLNVNSGAVVIGAMLISPLMGPIVGIGYSIATNDFETLKKAFKNLAIFVIVSILASFVYFGLSPIKTLTEQLAARTYPTFYDVLIAICGGAIGIVASSRSNRGNAIPGVAIATALMPPLCTVGYGIATANWVYAAGAFYLFFINSVFIASTAFLFVRALHFPHKEFLDPIKERYYKNIMLFIVIITIIPSLYTAYNVVQQEIFNGKVALFAKKTKSYRLEKGLIIGEPTSYFRQDTPSVEITIIGQLTKKDKGNLLNELQESGLNGTQLIFRSGAGEGDAESLQKGIKELVIQVNKLTTEHQKIKDQLYANKDKLLQDKNTEIADLKTQLLYYTKKRKRIERPVKDIALEFSALFPQAKEVSYSELIKMNTQTQKVDTIPTIILNWEGRKGIGKTQKQRISNFFKARMKLDTIEIIVY